MSKLPTALPDPEPIKTLIDKASQNPKLMAVLLYALKKAKESESTPMPNTTPSTSWWIPNLRNTLKMEATALKTPNGEKPDVMQLRPLMEAKISSLMNRRTDQTQELLDQLIPPEDQALGDIPHQLMGTTQMGMLMNQVDTAVGKPSLSIRFMVKEAQKDLTLDEILHAALLM